jgi:hypothetical protein
MNANKKPSASNTIVIIGAGSGGLDGNCWLE